MLSLSPDISSLSVFRVSPTKLEGLKINSSPGRLFISTKSCAGVWRIPDQKQSRIISPAYTNFKYLNKG